MVDKGGFLHNMEHSKNTQFDENGILYSNSYSKLRNDPGTDFQFGASFFLQIYVDPIYSVEAKDRLLFQKLTNDNKITLELWIKTTAPKGILKVKIDGAIKIYNDFFTYGTPVRIGIYLHAQRMEVYQDNILLENFKDTTIDDLNKVFLILLINE